MINTINENNTMTNMTQDSDVQRDSTSNNPVLKVNFGWKGGKAAITEEDKPNDPVYVVNCSSLKSPHLTFKSTADNSTIGTGTVHAISINAKYELQGQPGTLKALKRLKTAYTHLSRNFSNDGSLTTMTWTSKANFKTWDFICLDEQQMPVARFSSNLFYVKKVGNIEFMGDRATSKAAREEILVVGLTLYYCMLLRMNNVFNLLGSAFHRSGPLDKKAAQAEQDEREMQGQLELQDRSNGVMPPQPALVGDKGYKVA